MSAVTLAEQADAFGHLPSAHIEVNRSYPGKIAVSLHDGIGAFEPWREALRIPAEAVEFASLPSQVHLTAPGAFSGAAVELVAYGEPLPGGAA